MFSGHALIYFQHTASGLCLWTTYAKKKKHLHEHF